MKENWANGKIPSSINSINESKLEQEFIDRIIEIFPDRNVRRSKIKIDGRWFFPDIRIDKDIIIEFYGNYWHANPRIYNADNIVHHNITAQQIWNNDDERIKILEGKGFKCFIVWQDDYQNNETETIMNVINIIKEK